MARKSSDMVLLLGSRGQYRGRSSGFLKSLRTTLGGFFGRTGGGRSSSRSGRGGTAGFGGLLILAVAMAGFAGGFFVRGQFAAAAQRDGSAGLNVTPRTPSVVGETDTKPLANDAFIVCAYPGMAANDAYQRAKDASDWLRSHDVPRSQPLEFAGKDGPLWVVAVYYDGVAEQQALRQRLLQLPDSIPDAVFGQCRKSTQGWPLAMPVR